MCSTPLGSTIERCSYNPPGKAGEKGEKVISAQIGELELMEVWYEDDPTMQVKVNFPFYVGTGNKNTAVVYFEIEPGHRLGTHTDSAEEMLLVLDGTAELSLEHEPGEISAGEM